MHLTKIAEFKPFSGAPKINIASVYGASPNKPFLLRIPVTGERPISYGAQNLPEGLELEDNIITGSVVSEGDYEITLTAENALGKAEKKLTLEIHPGNILLTPLMGFTSWNAFAAAVNQEKMETTAQKMVELGISEYGYQYVNLDSGWQGEYGGEFDAIMPNGKFPDMKKMTDTIHSLGLKAGIYSTPMLSAWPTQVPLFPGCTTGEPDKRFPLVNGGIGVERKEKNNALQWSDWGFDYLKYDWEPTDTYNAEIMREILASMERDFGYCVTVRVIKRNINYWSKYVNSYRCCADSSGKWPNFLEIYRTYFEFMNNWNKGHYCDLDMLDMGNCRFKEIMTEDEQIVAYSARAFLGSPIQISTNLEKPGDFELAVYCNEEIIAINQDSAFCAALPIFRNKQGDAELDIFEKKLEDGTYAYAFFNIGETKQTVIGRFENNALLRDVWAKEDLPQSFYLDMELAPHTVRILKSSERIKSITHAVGGKK